jgi:hypothetical protein
MSNPPPAWLAGLGHQAPEEVNQSLRPFLQYIGESLNLEQLRFQSSRERKDTQHAFNLCMFFGQLSTLTA